MTSYDVDVGNRASDVASGRRRLDRGPLLDMDESHCDRCGLRAGHNVTACRGFCGRRICALCREEPREGSPCCLDCLRTGFWIPGRGLCSPDEPSSTTMDQTGESEGPEPDLGYVLDEAATGGETSGHERVLPTSGWVDRRDSTAGGPAGERRGPWPTNLFLPDGWICSVCGAWVSSWPQTAERSHWCTHHLGHPSPATTAKYVAMYPDSKGEVFLLLCDYCWPLSDDDEEELHRGYFCCRRRKAREERALVKPKAAGGQKGGEMEDG